MAPAAHTLASETAGNPPARAQHSMGNVLLALWLAFWFWVFYIGLLPLYLLLMLLPARWGRRCIHYLNCAWGRFILLSAGIRVRTSGPKLTYRGPMIIVANHRSYLDVPVCHVALPFSFRFLGKAELARVPLFGIMYRYAHISFKRTELSAIRKALLRGATALHAGERLCIYPEGTSRNPGKTLLPFKDGAFKLAARTGYPILPLAILGSDEHFAHYRGTFAAKPGIVHVVRGPLLWPEQDGTQLTTHDLHSRAEQWIFAQVEAHYQA